jgi:retinol-binding protein 3
MTRSTARLTFTLLFVMSTLQALTRAQAPPVPLDAATRAAVIDTALNELGRSYVFPDRATQMTRSIRDRQQRGEYDSIASGRQFADVLTAHLQEISRDQHLVVSFSPTVLPPMTAPPPEAIAPRRERERALLAKINFGFEKIEVVAATGYLDLRAFFEPDLMAETAVAAMNFLASADAVVIDLRSNRGGSPDGVALVASYLFDQPVHLNDIYDRRSGESRQFWTLPYVPGRRLAGKDVYLLTSARTFSAAEDFAYALKALKRVTIVGETTRGGAHPVTSHRIHDHFSVNVPWGRSLNSITKTNWEGVGVDPDVSVAADKALPTALLMSLEKRLVMATDPSVIGRLKEAIEGVRTELR